MQKINPFMWFDSQAEDAAIFYTSIFPNSKITNVGRYGEGSPGKPGSVMNANFQLNGQDFIALNGGPVYTFSEAISFFVNCETQAEVDHLWEKLSEGGKEIQCGWLTDKFGVTWQIIPTILGKLLSDPDPIKAQHVMQAMLKMVKIDSALLQQAYDQE
jgi:predicted 3-demethylubiquinone-9 3-methyltransferase (glyoxalase superfamily)